MLDLEIFSDPILEIDSSFNIINSNSFFNQFYDISKRKLTNNKLHDFFEISKQEYDNEIPFNMLVPKELGILFGTNVSQNIQFFKTKHPNFEGHTLLHFKDVDAEVRLHNKNLRNLRGEDNSENISNNSILKEILGQEHYAVFKIKEEKIECLHLHILPDLKTRSLNEFADYLNKHMSPQADWTNFFKLIGMGTIELADICDLIPEKLKFKNRLLTLKLVPIHEDNSIIFLFKDISENNKDEKVIENQKVLSHFYALFIKNPTLLNLFVSEINHLLSDKNEQPLKHTLHSLKGLLYFIGLKKFAEDIHVIEFLVEEDKQRLEFEKLKIQINSFFHQNTSNSSTTTVDTLLLDAFNIPFRKYVSLQTMIQNIDEISKFYLEYITSDYLKLSIDLKDFFISKEIATTLLSIFNHLIRNVGAHGDESTFKLEIQVHKNKLFIDTSNLIKEKSLSKIAFLSGQDIGVDIIKRLSQDHNISFSMDQSSKIFKNHFEIPLQKKGDLK